MWADRGRTKKLIVAFHFFQKNPAGWKCDECRKRGLESSRRCGYLAAEKRGPERLVWVRSSVGISECPVSFITAESIALLERFLAWRLDRRGVIDLPARVAEAIMTLESELRKVKTDGES